MTQLQVAEKLGINQVMVSRILKRHEEFLVHGRKYEKSERIAFLKRQLFHRNGKERISEKDPVDIISELRKEYEGDGSQTPMINNITYNIHGARRETRNNELIIDSVELLPEQSDTKQSDVA